MQKSLKTEKEMQRNLFVALTIVLCGLIGMEYIFPKQQPTVVETPVEVVTATSETQPVVPATDTVLAQVYEEVSGANTAQDQTISIDNQALSGQFDVQHGGINQLVLDKYKETIEPNSPDVTLLGNGYGTRLQWTGNAALPTATSKWQVSGSELTSEKNVTLTYQNATVKIVRTISLDKDYMFTIKDTLSNLSDSSLPVTLEGVIYRDVANLTQSRSVVHEGFFGVLNDKLVEKSYDDVDSDTFTENTAAGWMGITDKYWQTAFIFDKDVQDVSVSFQSQKVPNPTNGTQMANATFKTPTLAVPAHGQIEYTTRLFAGAKELDLINHYKDTLEIPKFDLSIDFGWFYYLTKPFLYFLNWLYAIVGNMGIAILIFATLLRLALLPVATKSYESMAKMRKVQPRIKSIQERFKDNRLMLQQEMMALYKREKINPAGGCLPMLVQIPVFYALYKVLSVSINMRQAPFYGWIQDLSVPDPSSVFTAFGYFDWSIPSYLDLGIWPILMGITMFVQQQMSPAPADKAQANMMRMMPVLFTFMLGNFAAGLVIYWTWSNVLSIAQQRYIMKKVGA